MLAFRFTAGCFCGMAHIGASGFAGLGVVWFRGLGVCVYVVDVVSLLLGRRVGIGRLDAHVDLFLWGCVALCCDRPGVGYINAVPEGMDCLSVFDIQYTAYTLGLFTLIHLAKSTCLTTATTPTRTCRPSLAK